MNNYEKNNEKTFTSIFDEIEGIETNPIIFAFQKNKRKEIVLNKNYNKEFQALFYSKSNEKLLLHKFILTSEAIYKFSVT